MPHWPNTPAPIPAKSDKVNNRHGRIFADPYHWFRDCNWPDVVRDPAQLSGDIRSHLLAENEYCAQMLAGTKTLCQQVLSEMKGRIQTDECDVAANDENWAYSSRFTPGGEHPIFVRYPIGQNGTIDETDEQILLDANARALPHAFYQLGEVTHSPDHTKLIWSEDVHGAELFEIFIHDLITGQTQSTGITAAGEDMVWLADSTGFLWVWRDENTRPKTVKLHHLGQDAANDAIIHHQQDDGFFLSISQTSDRSFALICCNDHQTSEIWTLPLDAYRQTPNCLWPRQMDIEADIDHANGYFSIITNAKGAKDFQILRIKDGQNIEQASTFIAHRPGVLLLGHQQFANFHVRLERENAHPRIIIHREQDGHEHAIHFESEAYALGLVPGYEFDTDTLRFTVSTPAMPCETYDYHMQTKVRNLRQRQHIPSGHDPEKYVVRRIFAPAADGELVPMTILHLADLTPNADTPVLLNGYGAYGYSIPAGFSANQLSLVDRAVVYAIAHVRGGKEKGFAWYENGRRAHKENTFTDFIACAEYLIDQGMTAPGNIVAMGASAGGLLLGAVANLRPDLFAGFVARVPFVDVLNTMSDKTLPLTPPEWPEWGNPLTSKQDCETIAKYCPISNICEQAYPPIFATAGLTDTRVTWWEPAKWIATLRDTAPKGGPYLLKTEMSAGHGGQSGRYGGLEEVAETTAFALYVLGLGAPDVAAQ